MTGIEKEPAKPNTVLQAFMDFLASREPSQLPKPMSSLEAVYDELDAQHAGETIDWD